jgi:excisionase family DNA binding protein
MSPGGTLLTSTEVAQLLGVTAATVKRWADSGRLACARTAGRHRRFARDAVERFRREHASPGPLAVGFVDRLLEESEPFALQAELLRERARRGAWWRVAEWLGEEIEDLGRRWEEGRIGIVEEHVASERLARTVARCAETLPPRADAPRILLAAAEGEEHLLGLALVDLCVREEGWRSRWSGRVTPTAEVIRLVRAGAVEAVALSASVTADRGSLAAEAAAVGRECASGAVRFVAGGRGPWPEPLPHGALLRDFDGLRRWMAAVESERR